MIRHLVFVKFRHPLDSEETRTFIREVDRIPELNPEVQNWVSGLSPEPRFHNGDYDWGLSCDLADWDAMDRYMWHEAHLRSRPFAIAAAAHLHSFDFQIDFVANPNSGAKAPESPPPPPRGQVPPVLGHSLQDARALVEAAGLTVSGDPRPLRGTVWAKDRVRDVEPPIGTALPPGAGVTLIVAADWRSAPQA
jgi:hypothetical protein